MGDEIRRDVARQLLVDVEPHVSELEADVGLELSRRNLIEKLVIERGTVPGLFHVGDVLAEVVDADGHAMRVGPSGGVERLADAHAGNEAAGEPASDARSLGECAKGLAFRKGDEEGPGHAFATTTAQTRDAPAFRSAAAQARSVSAVVQTSSTMSSERSRAAADAVKASRTFEARSVRGSVDWG